MADSEDRSPADLLCDLFVYAPLGFAFEAPRLVPEMAARGREQVAAARTVGRFVVQQANERLTPVIGSVLTGFLSGLGLTDNRTSGEVSPSAPPAPPDATEASDELLTSAVTDAMVDDLELSDRLDVPDLARAPAEVVAAPQEAPEADALGIPDYDSLAASQVVPRLAALSPEELAAVRAYESAHRGRRTILHRVDQLLARPGTHGG